MNLSPDSVKQSSAVALLAAAGFIFTMACFYPGAMSYDDAVTWSRVRGAPTDNVGGVGLLGLWRLTEPIISGPGGPFALTLALFWVSLAMIANALRLTLPGTAAFLCLVCCAPVCFVMLGRMGTDTALMAALTATTAVLLRYRDAGLWPWLLAAAALALWACTLRHNAAPAVLPFAVYAAWLWTRRHPRSPRLPGGGAAFILASVAFSSLLGVSMLLDRCVDERRTVFHATTLWDLAAVSVLVDEILLPGAIHGPGLDIEDLRQAVEPYANTPLFSRTRAGMSNPFLLPDDPLNGEILRAWLGMIAQHPRAYAAHRWRVVRGLLGLRPRSWPHELVYFDGAQPFRGNPQVIANTSALHVWCIRMFETFRDTVVFAAWPYILIALLACGVAWRRRHPMDAVAALTVLASGVFYALPLTIVAPSAELRYTGWSCLSALLGLGLALQHAAPDDIRVSNKPVDGE